MARALIGIVALVLIVASATVCEAQTYHRYSKVRLATGTSSDASAPRAFDARVVTRYLPAIRYCYLRQLRQASSLGSGTVVVRFVIDAAGKVISARANGPADSWKPVARCTAAILFRARFRPQKDSAPIEVRYPIRFVDGQAIPPAKPSPKRLTTLRRLLRQAVR